MEGANGDAAWLTGRITVPMTLLRELQWLLHHLSLTESLKPGKLRDYGLLGSVEIPGQHHLKQAPL